MATPEVAFPPAPPPGPNPSEAAPLPPPSRFLRALAQSPEKEKEAALPSPAEDAPASPSPGRFAEAQGKSQEAAVEVPEIAVVASSGTRSEPEPLVQALIDSTEDPEACLSACATLEAATARSSILHRRVLAAGGAEALVTAMTAHREVADIQLVACHALQHLAATASCSGAARVAEAGGCRVLLVAIGGPDPLLAQAGHMPSGLWPLVDPCRDNKPLTRGR